MLIAGEDIRRWPLGQLRGVFSVVSQNGGVFSSNTTNGLKWRAKVEQA